MIAVEYDLALTMSHCYALMKLTGLQVVVVALPSVSQGDQLVDRIKRENPCAIGSTEHSQVYIC